MPSLSQASGSRFIQRSFAAGELASALYARVDHNKYATGLRTCRNFFVRKEGGASNRAGTEFIAEVKTSAKAVRLIPFIFNDAQTYILEFGDQYMRVFREGAAIEVSGVTAWSGATAYVVGDLASRLGVNYYCIAAHTNQQPPNATYWHPLTGAIYEIPTPYTEAQLPALGFTQSADVITIVHPSHAPRELARSAHTTWTLTSITFAPGIAAPGSPAAAGGTGTGKDWEYVVTAVAEETYEESLPSAAATLSNKADPTAAAPNVFTWAAVSGAVEYNVYRQKPIPTGGTFEDTYGYMGTTAALQFNDDNSITPDLTDTPPAARNPFSGTDKYPASTGYFQQRRLFAASNDEPEKVWATRAGLPDNMTISSPLQDDDAVTFVVRGKRVNRILHMVELDELLVLTSGGEWMVLGDDTGILRPGGVNPKQQGYHGTYTLPPLIAGSNVLYVQGRGTVVRDLILLAGKLQGDKGDLTVFSSHLFRGKSIADWTYSENPDSIVWAARSDGILLGMTYLPEHEVWGWHRHDTYTLAGQSVIENVCAVPEGMEDALYMVVKRVIDGSTVRYIERMASRETLDVVADPYFVDCGLTYDGRAQTGTLTLTGGTDWTHEEDLTATLAGAAITLDSGYFGDEFVYEDEDGEVYRFTIKEALSGTEATVNASKTIPAALREAALSSWDMARKDFAGLDHLEGETVSIFSDGSVEPQKEVASGAVSLENPGAYVHVGLPIEADLQTLDIDNPAGATLVSKKKNINRVTLFVESSRGILAGPAADSLEEYKQRDVADGEDPIPLLTGVVEIDIKGGWNSNGRIFVRQSDPLPLSVLAAVPSGYVE